LWSVKLWSVNASMRFGWMNFRFFPGPRCNVPECVQGFPSLSCKAYNYVFSGVVIRLFQSEMQQWRKREN
jgi:hypothetical protein